MGELLGRAEAGRLMAAGHRPLTGLVDLTLIVRKARSRARGYLLYKIYIANNIYCTDVIYPCITYNVIDDKGFVMRDCIKASQCVCTRTTYSHIHNRHLQHLRKLHTHTYTFVDINNTYVQTCSNYILTRDLAN